MHWQKYTTLGNIEAYCTGKLSQDALDETSVMECWRSTVGELPPGPFMDGRLRYASTSGCFVLCFLHPHAIFNIRYAEMKL